MQNETFYNGKMPKKHFALSLFLASIWKFLIKHDDINSIFHLDKFLQIHEC